MMKEIEGRGKRNNCEISKVYNWNIYHKHERMGDLEKYFILKK